MSDHAVILYGDDVAALSHCVVPFIAPGLQDGGAAVVISSAQHERAFRSALEAVAIDPTSDAIRDRLVFLNAHDTLKGIVVDEEVVAQRFDRLIGNVIRNLSKRYTVHAYGELVGVLRATGQPEAAARLEHLWGKLATEVPFDLLCGYPIDVLGAEFHPGEMDVILTSHTRLISALTDFEGSLYSGIESTLGSQRAASIRGMVEATQPPGRAALPQTEATLLWLREHLPELASDIIAKARFEG